MNIEELKKALQEINELKALFNGQLLPPEREECDPFLGQYVIVRTYGAGVFAGILKQRLGKKVLLENVRRLWRWHTANNGVSLSEVAVYGINQSNSKICCVEPLKQVEDIEISPCTDIARKSIEEAKEHVYND